MLNKNTKYKCYIISRSRFPNSSIISLNLIILFSTYTCKYITASFNIYYIKLKKLIIFEIISFITYFIKRHRQILK